MIKRTLSSSCGWRGEIVGDRTASASVCGATCGDSENHGNQTWIGVSNLTDIKSGGYYYLTDNVKLNDTWICTYDVALCLNGKTITCAAEVDAIQVAKGTKLIITDCQKVVGKITHAQDNIGRGIMSLGTLILYNGELPKTRLPKVVVPVYT